MVNLHRLFWVTQRRSLSITLDISEKTVAVFSCVLLLFQFFLFNLMSFLFVLYNVSVCVRLCNGQLLNLYIHVQSFIHLFVYYCSSLQVQSETSETGKRAMSLIKLVTDAYLKGGGGADWRFCLLASSIFVEITNNSVYKGNICFFVSSFLSLLNQLGATSGKKSNRKQIL